MKSLSTNRRGFSLLEVLIAVILLSVGMLGVAAMQLKSQHFNRGAYFETQAIIIAHDMLERMRSNIAGQRAGHYHLPDPTRHNNCYNMAGCSTIDMAQNDMFEWAIGDTDSISNKLPGGTGVVCLDSTPDDGFPSTHNCDNSGNTYAIKVWWKDSEDEMRRSVITAAFE